jgi:hypothetical protein
VQGRSGFLTPHLRAAIRRGFPPDGATGTMRHNGPTDADRTRSGQGAVRARSIPRLVGYATVGNGLTAAGYAGLVTGACTLDIGIGRRVRPLGPLLVDMAAPREVVFDVIAEPTGPGPQESWPKSCGWGTRQRHGPGSPLHPPNVADRAGLWPNRSSRTRWTLSLLSSFRSQSSRKQAKHL